MRPETACIVRYLVSRKVQFPVTLAVLRLNCIVEYKLPRAKTAFHMWHPGRIRERRTICAIVPAAVLLTCNNRVGQSERIPIGRQVNINKLEQIKMTTPVPIKKSDSVLDELNHLRERITKRAYEIFEAKGQIFGNDIDHWLQAEAELIWRPAIDMQEKENEFYLRVATPGVDPKDIHIEVTAEDILIRAECGHEHHPEKSEVHVCEFTAANLFRAIHFPKRIDPDTVKAEFKNGILSLTAGIAKESRAREVELTRKSTSSAV